MILDDEDVLIKRISNDAKEEMFCKYLGKVYVTKQGVWGYVWDVKADGTPKTLARPNSNKINWNELRERMEQSLSNFYKKYGWYIPTVDKFTSASWNNVNLDYEKISCSLINNAYQDYTRLNYQFVYKSQTFYLSRFDDEYWLKSSENVYDLFTSAIIISSVCGVTIRKFTHDSNLLDYNNCSRSLLFLKDLEDDEIQTYEESDIMIQETIEKLPRGVF
jgi:hypothetical protein